MTTSAHLPILTNFHQRPLFFVNCLDISKTMGEQSGEYLNLQGFEHQNIGDTSEASARLQASQWTTFGISLHKLMSVMGGQKKEFPPWVEEATTALAKGGAHLPFPWSSFPKSAW
jgi:hypothetical protein